jgi:hypothetical protein
MKRRIRPIGSAGDKTVFDRIEVTVVDMTREIVIVTYRMFPGASLPNRYSPFASATKGDPAETTACVK